MDGAVAGLLDFEWVMAAKGKAQLGVEMVGIWFEEPQQW